MPILTDRKREILKCIVSEHVQTASPVPSSTVARFTNLKASPATIRNEMVALEEDGFIHRPHVSSGGVPSDRGYRQFVASLDPEAALHPRVSTRIDQELESRKSYIEECINSASEILSGLMDTLAFATLPRTALAPVKSVELLRLQEMLLVVIVVLQEASVYKQIINIDAAVTNSEIEHARNRLSEVIVGVPTHNLADRSNHVNDGLERQAFESAITAIQQHNQISVKDNRFTGIGKIFQQPELIADPELSVGVTWLIEDSLSSSIFDDASESQSITSVIIGEENTEENLKNFSLVFNKYGSPDTAKGVIGVIAPTRMEYETAIPAVRHLTGHLNKITMKLYG
ncbi:MAG: heat-inducible transcription repressor HrcA [SAR202 cluster bacterium]|mgnify:CR=1 FL=1|nr:heat-inducible transcription repressor HrcA [Chloroflexota bacterium]MQG88733.1 heat-inducible transcription repressor HrcA [SAR202 cluster bacterium]|tara:strand:- start:1112 stop:2140 length:1029 start_codon:yes stop_codon:yes gene_type:complete